MRLVLSILCILCTAGGLLANAESSNNSFQLLSLYIENAEKTASKIVELTDKLPLFIEVAQGQKDIIETLLEIRQFSLSKDIIIESMFSYNAIAELVQSQFFINFNYRTEEDANAIIFQGKYFLSSYINMYWLNKMGLDDEASLKLLFSYFINSKTKNFLIQKGVLDNISSQYLEGSPPDLAVISKAQESQKKYQSELTSSQFIDSKLQESKLFMNISMYSKEGVLKNYQEVFTKIEPYFYIFTTHELDLVCGEVMALTLSEAHKDVMIENTIFEVLYNRTSILIDPNNISYGFQEIDQYMVSVYIEKQHRAIPILLQYYKDVHVQLIEIPEVQYETLTEIIAIIVNQSEKQVQRKIIKSSLSLKHITLLTESQCLQNESEDEIQVIFKDKIYLLSLLIEIEKNKTQMVSLPFEGRHFFFWDAFQWMKDEISNDEFFRSTHAEATAIGFGVLGGKFGMALGPVGAIFGAATGYYFGSHFSSSFPLPFPLHPIFDIQILIDTISKEIYFYSTILNESEIKITFKAFKKYLKATFKSFEKDSKSEESKAIIFDFYKRYVNKALIEEIQRRQPQCLNYQPQRKI